MVAHLNSNLQNLGGDLQYYIHYSIAKQAIKYVLYKMYTNYTCQVTTIHKIKIFCMMVLLFHSPKTILMKAACFTLKTLQWTVGVTTLVCVFLITGKIGWLASEILVMIAEHMCIIYWEPSGAGSMLYCWSPSQCYNWIQYFSMHML